MTKLKFGALIVASLFLSSCEQVGFELPAMPFAPSAAQDSAAAFLGLATVKAPEGFCIARQASQLATGFAVIVPCNTLESSRDLPPHLGFITVQLDGRGTAAIAGSEDALLDVLRSDQVKALLNDPPVREVLETDADDGAVAVHYRIDSTERTENLSNDVWRLFGDIDGRLATVSLRGFKDAPLSVDDGRTLLYRTLRVLRDANS